MAAANLFPPNEVYRGLRNKNWVKRGVIQYLAYMLRPAKEPFPLETELSLGLTPQSAVSELVENHGTARLFIQEVHSLPYGLTVRADVENPTKAYMYGLPTHSLDEAQRGSAMTVATALANISSFASVDPPN